MKIRQGFVSNSSSSSFVVLLPKNFMENIDYNKITDGDEDYPIDDFKRELNNLISDGGSYLEEIENNEWDFESTIIDLIDPYVIASVETSSDQGQIVIVDREDVMKIIEETKD